MEEQESSEACEEPNFDESPDNKIYFEKLELENVDLKIFLDRLIEIFNVVMAKLEFAAVVPQVLSHPRVIEVLTKEDMNQIIEAFSVPLCSPLNMEDTVPSLEDWGSAVITNLTIVASKTSSKLQKSASLEIPSNCPKTNVQIYKILEILAKYPLVCHVAKKSKSRISKAALCFIRQIEYFMSFGINKTKLTPYEKRQKDLHLRSVLKGIEHAHTEIHNLNIALEEQKTRHRVTLKKLLDERQTLHDKLDTIYEEYNEDRLKILDDSDNNMATSQENFNERLAQLENLLEKAKDSLDQQIQLNRKVENDIKGKKFKVESQLLGVLTKYDTEIGDRQAIFEDLQRQVDDLDKEKAELMVEMNIQLDFYNSIIAEREAKEFAAFKEKYDEFVQKRSAKIIQRWWRAILKKRRKGKKKGKKGKKKK